MSPNSKIGCNKTRWAKRLVASVVLKNANKSSLQKHKDTAKYKTNYQSAKSTADIVQFIRKKPPVVDEQIPKSELIIASYFSEHKGPHTWQQFSTATAISNGNLNQISRVWAPATTTATCRSRCCRSEFSDIWWAELKVAVEVGVVYGQKRSNMSHKHIYLHAFELVYWYK